MSEHSGTGVDLYLDLMKKALTDALYMDDPMALMVPLDVGRRSGRLLPRLVLGWLQTALQRRGIYLVEHQRVWYSSKNWSLDDIRQRRLEGTDWPVRAHTMVGLQRLDNLQHCVTTAVDDGVEGDLIETGVWRGGATILMKAILRALGEEDRRVFVADSFAGLPAPHSEEYPHDSGCTLHRWSELAVSRAQVEENFRKYGLLDDNVVFLEGWFRDTLADAPITKLAVLRMDGDMFESTIQVLEALYHKVSPGGFVIVDDYHLPPCRAAVHDFLRSTGVAPEIQKAGARGTYWRVD